MPESTKTVAPGGKTDELQEPLPGEKQGRRRRKQHLSTGSRPQEHLTAVGPTMVSACTELPTHLQLRSDHQKCGLQATGSLSPVVLSYGHMWGALIKYHPQAGTS